MKMKKFNFYLLGLFFALSCNEIPTPIPPPIEVPEGRVIMIEELTGVSCTPCAAASAILEEILDNGDGAVVAYGVHGRFQSEPLPDSKYDFRNEDAEELESYLVEFGKPAASFNRTTSNTGSLVYGQPATWQAFVDEELVKPVVANVEISSSYNDASRRLDISVDVRALVDLEGTINVVVAVSESNLIDPQSAPGEAIPDFKHKHVLKKLLTPVLGDAIASSGMIAGESETAMYSYTIPAELNGEWIPSNMEITAFITAEDRNGEIQQAAQEPVIP
jgi:hypothetical protein